MSERKKYLNNLKKELTNNLESHHCFSLVFDLKGEPFIIHIQDLYFCKILDFNSFLSIKECLISDLDYDLLKQTSIYLEKYSNKLSIIECFNKSQNKIYFKLRKNSYCFLLNFNQNSHIIKS